MLWALYRGLTTLAGPAVPVLLNRRTRAGKEDAARRGERLGRPSRPRPDGPLVWIHAASVGEALSVQRLIGRLLDQRGDLAVLMTTGTVTSARLMAQRLPARAVHQYLPVDRAPYARRFLDHWRPDLVLWVESELWPNLLGETRRRGIPAALINARMSDRSFARWRRLPRSVRRLLSAFDLVLPWDDAAAAHYRALGASAVGPAGNLKLSAAPPAADAAALAALRAAIGDRPVWLAASTHDGEEAIAAEVHHALARRLPGLLTMIAPRHPARGDAVADLLQSRGLAVARRSAGDRAAPETAVYLADTLGEMGLLFRLAPVVFVGGSLVPHGGHNPIEPAQLGCAVLYGPHMGTFTDMTGPLEDGGGARPVPDAAGLEAAVAALLADPAAAAAMAARAGSVARSLEGTLDRALEALAPLLGRLDARAAAPPAAGGRGPAPRVRATGGGG